MADWKPTALSAMHHRHVAHGATMVERGGWRMPARYTSVDEEIASVRDAVGICDISPAGKLSLQGEELDPLLRTTFPGSAAFETGRAQSGRANGGPSALDVLVARLASDEALLFTAPGRAPALAESLGRSTDCAHVVDVTSALAGARIVGPMSRGLLAAVTELDTSADVFPDLSCAQGKFAEVYGVLIRQDLGGLLGYRFYFGRELGEYMWDVLLEAGEEHGVVPFGIETLASLGS